MSNLGNCPNQSYVFAEQKQRFKFLFSSRYVFALSRSLHVFNVLKTNTSKKIAPKQILQFTGHGITYLSKLSLIEKKEKRQIKRDLFWHATVYSNKKYSMIRQQELLLVSNENKRQHPIPLSSLLLHQMLSHTPLTIHIE